MKKPQILLLDLGKVVFELDWLKPIEQLGLQNSKLEKILVKQLQTWGPYDQYERGKITTDDFMQFINQNTDEKISEEAFKAAWQTMIVGYFSGMAELLQTLSENIPLYALTNTNPLHYEQIINHYPEMEWFHKIFTSIHTGFRKPEKEIFEFVTDELNVKPQDILYIDDSLGHVEAGKSFGFTAELYQGSSALDLRRLLWKYRLLTS